MSHSLFRFTLGSLLLAGGSIAWGQGSSDRAYPMNVEDRINEVSSKSDDSGYDDNGRSIGAAGAYPMNAIDRINSGWRESLNTTDRIRSPGASSGTLRGGATTSRVITAAPSLKDRPDAWRYRWFENRWWYYGANNHWLYWQGNHWNAFASASAVDNDATGHAH